jgi:hypothetical protein
MMILVLPITLAGFSCLLASMSRHQTDWFGRRLERAPVQALRAGGFALLALACTVAFLVEEWVGVVTWIGAMTAAAAAIITLNCWKNHSS